MYSPILNENELKMIPLIIKSPEKYKKEEQMRIQKQKEKIIKQKHNREIKRLLTNTKMPWGSISPERSYRSVSDREKRLLKSRKRKRGKAITMKSTEKFLKEEMKTRRKKNYNKRTRKKGGGNKPKKVYDIIKIFKQYPNIFPRGYFRFLPAVLEKHIKDKTLIYKNGVVLTYTKYKKRPNKYAKYGIEGGDVKIHQFLNKNQGNGKAKSMFKKFINKHKKSNFVLEVMKNNRRAIKFYNKNGFRKVGNTKFGKLSGIIMVKKKK